MNYKQQNISNATKEGYSKKALEALTKGTYKQTREGSVASYKRQQARQKQSVPSLNKGTAYQNNVQNNAQKYQYNEAAKKANTLSKEDLKFMDDLYQNFDMGGNMASVLKASGKTAGWEKKYGKSYKQIVDDYEADRKNRVMEQGEKHPVLSALGTVGSKTLQTPFEAVGDFLTKVTSPGSDNAKYADYIRGREEEDIKLKRAGIKEHTGEIGDKVIDTALPIADRMAVSSFDKLLKTGGLFTGLSDYSNYMEDLNQRPGMNDRRKALSALAHGAVEGAGTAITRGALDKIPAVEGVGGKILNMAKGGGNAAIENFISELIEMGSDTAINKENSQKELNKASYMAQGMTEDEATRQARIDQAKQAGMAGLTGFLFGAGTKGISEGFDAIKKIPALKGIFGGKTNAPEADDPVIANATKQAEQAVEEIDTLKQQIPETPETAPANDIKLVRNKETGEYSYENFRVVKDGKQNYAIIDPEGNTVGNARTLKDAKSMIADTRSDVALEDTGIERNPTITETVGETAPVEVDPENVIYHSGILSRLNKADTAGKMEGMRDTGYYGTGHYFVDGAHKGEIGKGSSYGNKPYSSVDISKYDNLFRADTDAKANNLHDFSQKMMRYVNKYNDKYFTDDDGNIIPEELADYMDDMYEQYAKLFGNKAMPFEDFANRMDDFRKGYNHDLYDREDSAFTTFMKEHGYNGVDTRGTKSADTTRGVVIYDLDEDSVLQSNVTDQAIKDGLMNTRVRNGNPVFDEETDAGIQERLDAFNNRKAIEQEYAKLYDSTKSKNLYNDISDIQKEINNLEQDTIPYYERIANDDAYLEERAQELVREFEQFGMTGDIEKTKADMRNDAVASLPEANSRLLEAKDRLARLQQEYDAEEELSRQAYEQAKANVEGVSEEAVDSAVADSVASELEPRISNVDSTGKALSDSQREYFKDSKVVDDNGNLLVMYHGSRTKEKFKEFDPNRPSTNGRMLGDGVYFTPDRKVAENWAKGAYDGKPNVYKVYLDMKNPFYISDNIPATQDMIDYAVSKGWQPSAIKTTADIMTFCPEYARQNGYDGLILKADENSDFLKTYGDQYVVFESSQIKHTNNKKIAGVDPAPKTENVPVESETTTPVVAETNRVPAVEQTANEVPPEPGEEKIRSFSKRGSMDEELPEEIRNTLSEDMYRVVRNAETSARADELFDPNNLTQTRSNLKQAIDSHDPASALLSYKLAKAYVDAGEYDAATDVLEEVSAELTRMGQFTQAAKLAMMQNDPMAAMRSYERDLQKLNQWGKKKYKKKWNDLKLDKEDIDLFNKVQKGDKEGLNEVVNQLNAKFGKKVPSTWWDKLVGATKTAMLLNFRTQSRNGLANMAVLPMRSASDRVSALGQNIVRLFDKDFEVNQSLLGGTKEQKKIAAQIFENSKNEILGENKMKDSVKSDILSHRQTFNNDFLAKWIDNRTNGGIQRLNEYFGADANTSTMETLQNLTYWLMGDVGDAPFVKKNFVNRLASYMKAQGINNIEDVPDEAVAIATQEALKATFKDDNAFSKALQGVKQKTGKFGEVALPFVKTPANLTMRAVDYSPAGIINTIRKARSGAELNDVIDDLSKNLTGTALIYLGYKLAEKGIISGAYSADKDEASFQKQQGMLEYSFHIPDDVPVIGGNYYSYDWSQPASTPLVIGTTIYEAIKNSDKENNEIKDIVNGVYRGGLNVTNTIINSSPLQSLSDILGSDGTDEGGVAGNIANEIMEFPQRLIPSILGATARTIDPTIRDTYVSDNTLTGTLGNQLRSAQAKIPFLSETLPASYDTWGNERKRSDSVGEAFIAQMVNPGQVGNKNITPIDDEIQKIYDETGNAAVFPLNAARKLDLGSDGNITLTNKQHSDYQRLMGQTSYKFAENLINNEDFQSLSSDEKAATLESVYKLSNELAKEELFNHTTDNNKELKEIARTGDVEAVTQYLMDKQKAKSLDMDVRTYREKEAEQPGGAVQYAETKQEAVDNGFVTKDGNANVKQYEKVLEQAGQYSDKVLNDLPILESSGLKPSAYYYYAKAVNVLPSLTPNEFATTYKAIDTNPDNAMTQKEVLAYLNKGNYTDQQANQLWLMYAPEGKKLPYLKKDGTWGAK